MKDSPAPLNDTIIHAVARLVYDAQGVRRDPSHADLETQVERAGLASADPNRDPVRAGRPVGKEKRIRHVLSWALEYDTEAGGRLVGWLIDLIRGCGGFRPASPNYCGEDAIADAMAAFRDQTFALTADGHLQPRLLQSLAGRELTVALRVYVERAQRGALDAALVTGTGKDLLEAVAAHVLRERYGSYSHQSHFPVLLGQAFAAVGLAATDNRSVGGSTPGDAARQAVEYRLYELGCAVNQLRNKEGTGHGRPFLPSVTRREARTAVEAMGLIAARLLDALED